MHARTSQNDALQIDTLGPVERGRLGSPSARASTTPSPRPVPGTGISTPTCARCSTGGSTVVTLMETQELDLLRVPDLGERVSRTGLRWWHLPIVDGGIPDHRFEHAWSRPGEDLRRRLVAGEGVVVHCRGGLGRTGIVAARLLIEFGEAPETALFRVRRARTGTVENRRQEEYVRDLGEVQGIFETDSVSRTRWPEQLW